MASNILYHTEEGVCYERCEMIYQSREKRIKNIFQKYQLFPVNPKKKYEGIVVCNIKQNRFRFFFCFWLMVVG